MAHRQATRGHFVPDLIGQLEQPLEVGDRRAILADRGRNPFLGQVELVGETPVGKRLLNRVQILALDVFDQRHFEQRLLGAWRDVAHHHRHAQQPGDFRGAPAAFAGDDLESIADLAHHDRLDDAVGADRLRELLQPRIVDIAARLKVVRLEAIDVGLDCRWARRFRRVGD